MSHAHRISPFPGDGPGEVVCRACRRPIYRTAPGAMPAHIKHTPKRK